MCQWVWGTQYTDTTAAAGTTYYYWLKAYKFNFVASQYMYSVFSACDAGYANQAPVASLTVSPSNGAAPLRATLRFLRFVRSERQPRPR